MKKVIALGDSLTWGFPYGPDASWLIRVEQSFPELNWINQGINGDTFSGMLWRIQRDVLLEKPAICIVEAGINDAFTMFSLEEIEKDLDAILEELAKHSIQVVLVLPLNVEVVMGPVPKLAQIRQLIKLKSEQWSFALLDFQVLEPEHFVDEVHPNRLGYQVIAHSVTEQMKQLFSSGKLHQ